MKETRTTTGRERSTPPELIAFLRLAPYLGFDVKGISWEYLPWHPDYTETQREETPT